MADANGSGQGPAGVFRAYRGSLSIITLAVSNMIPLWGVCFQDWDVFAVMLLFWLENVVIGLFNVCRMVTVPPQTIGLIVYKFFLIPFFIFHYGVFALAHGVFVFALFCPEFFKAGDTLAGAGTLTFQQIWTLLRGFIPSAVPFALAALILSHGASFVSNFLMRGECRLTTVDALMTAPYRRVVILHLTLIAGAFIVNGIGAQKPVIAVFVLLKIVMDMVAHYGERKRYENKKSAGAPLTPTTP